jgi:hypothetical protein
MCERCGISFEILPVGDDWQLVKVAGCSRVYLDLFPTKDSAMYFADVLHDDFVRELISRQRVGWGFDW